MSIKVNYHSSIRIDDGKVMYFDPWKIEEEPHDADIVFITHSHHDHFSPEDIKKLLKDDTIVIAPESCRKDILSKLDIDEALLVSIAPGKEIVIGDTNVKAIPAYNIGKDFHKKEYEWCGYVVTTNRSYYVAGDTDVTPEMLSVKADTWLVPVGGTYTMDYNEAAEAVNKVKPDEAIPMHFGSVAGDPDFGERFLKLIRK